MKNPTLILTALAALTLAGTLPAQKIEIVDGARIVHNDKGGKFGAKPPLAINLVRKLGDVDTMDENLAFNYPGDITTDAAGNIYVLDSANNRIQKFDSNGKFIATIGRRGQGPGEFYNPDSFGFDAAGTLWVMDGYQNRIQTFTPDGKGDKTIPLLDRMLRRLRLLKSGRIAVQAPLLYTSFNDKSKPPKLLRILGPDGKAVGECVDPFDYGEPSTNVMANSIYYDVDDGDDIVVAFRAQNKVEKYGPDGRLLWRADRPLGYSMEIRKKGKMNTSGTGNTRGISISPPEMNVCSLGIAADAKDRLWVVTYGRQLKKEEEVRTSMMTTMGAGGTTVSQKTTGAVDLRTTDAFKLEVFDKDGVLLGEIPLTHFVDEIRICGDDLFLLDKVRGVTFYQYKIVEK
jgi:hypothetical protein